MEEYKYSNINDVMSFIETDSKNKFYTISLLEKETSYSNDRIRNALYVLTKDKYLLRIKRGIYIKNDFKSLRGIDKILAVLGSYYGTEFKVFKTYMKNLLDAGLTTQITKTDLCIHSMNRIEDSEEEVNKLIKSISSINIKYVDLHNRKNSVKIVSKYFNCSDDIEKAIKLINDSYEGIISINNGIKYKNRNFLLVNNLQDKTSLELLLKLNDKYNDYYISLNS